MYRNENNRKKRQRNVVKTNCLGGKKLKTRKKYDKREKKSWKIFPPSFVVVSKIEMKKKRTQNFCKSVSLCSCLDIFSCALEDNNSFLSALCLLMSVSWDVLNENQKCMEYLWTSCVFNNLRKTHFNDNVTLCLPNIIKNVNLQLLLSEFSEPYNSLMSWSLSNVLKFKVHLFFGTIETLNS